MLAGKPIPLGPSESENPEQGINFALWSHNATKVTLELFNSDGRATASFVLDPKSNKTGSTWHISIAGLPKSGVLYGFRVDGEGGWETGHRWDPSKVMLDPYAPLVAGRLAFAVRDEFEQYKPKVKHYIWLAAIALWQYIKNICCCIFHSLIWDEDEIENER